MKGLMGGQQLEERVAFVSDKAFYLTKPNSEVTRCFKIADIKKLITNAKVRGPNEELWLVVKMAPPEYDIQIANPNIEALIQCLLAIYTYLTRGKELPVEQQKEPKDAQLDRPKGFEMVMVIPTTKDQLKKALDVFAAKHGIQFADGSAPAAGGAPKAVAPAPAKTAADNKVAPRTDPLGAFLLLSGLEQYYAQLYKQNVDLDVIECMDDADIKTFGVANPAHIATIRQNIRNDEFMTRVRNEVQAARSGAKGWTAPPAPAAGAPPAASAPKAPIILDDDDFLPPVPSQKVQMAICLDSDDDLPIPAAKPAAKPSAAPIMLDDDI